MRPYNLGYKSIIWAHIGIKVKISVSHELITRAHILSFWCCATVSRINDGNIITHPFHPSKNRIDDQSINPSTSLHIKRITFRDGHGSSSDLPIPISGLPFLLHPRRDIGLGPSLVCCDRAGGHSVQADLQLHLLRGCPLHRSPDPRGQTFSLFFLW